MRFVAWACPLVLTASAGCAGRGVVEPPPASVPERHYRVESGSSPAADGTVHKDVAARQDLEPSDLCDQRDAEGDPMVEKTRRRVEEAACTAALWFDGLFGDRYYVGEARKASGQIEVWQSYSDYYGARTRVRFDLDVELPNLNDRLFGFVGRDDEEEYTRDRHESAALRANFPDLEDNDTWLAGLGYRLPRRGDFSADFRVGASSLSDPKAFAQTRLYYRLYSDDANLAYLRATPFYTTRDGFGVTTGLTYSYLLSSRRLLRWASFGTRSQKTDGLDWRTALILYERHGRLRGMAYEVFIRGETQEEVPVRDYGLEITFRHPFADDRLFAEWVLGYSFPRREPWEDREGSPGVGVGVEMPFGQRRY